MIDLLPLAFSARMPDAKASLLIVNEAKALLVAMPMSKQRPFTEYFPDFRWLMGERRRVRRPGRAGGGARRGLAAT
jgi:hypothetical protein